MNNILLQTDSYKATHWKQYPPGTETVYSYFESRGGKFQEIVFFGLQYYLKKYLSGIQVTQEKIDEAEYYYGKHFGNTNLFNRAGWQKIIDKCAGYLPIRIKAVPEGTIVNNRNVLMTIENTDPEFYWLTNFLETMLVQVWYPTTVATQSHEISKLIKEYLIKTGCKDETEVLWKCHDFGYRDSTSQESASLGGAAHLISFFGTDTVAALKLIKDYYNSDICGFSIPASEHSTITSWGREHEVDAFRNMLEQYPTGLVACVSDSYNIYEACWKLWGTELKDLILKRDGRLIIRPDSGDPIDVVLKVLNILGEYFGYSINENGYKVLNDKIRIIQGDGVNYDTINEIYKNITLPHSSGEPGNGNVTGKWAAENVGFGSGGALLQKMDRDTLKFAFKCSSITINGNEQDVYKNPITDPGKISKKGRLKLTKVNHEWDTQPEWSNSKDYLETVFENGVIKKEYSFEEIRVIKNGEK